MEDTTIITISDVFGIWGSLVDLAADVGQSQWAVIKWKKRKAIPPEYWQSLCNAAQLRNKRLTAEDLMRVHAAPTPEPSPPSSGIAA